MINTICQVRREQGRAGVSADWRAVEQLSHPHPWQQDWQTRRCRRGRAQVGDRFIFTTLHRTWRCGVADKCSGCTGRPPARGRWRGASCTGAPWSSSCAASSRGRDTERGSGKLVSHVVKNVFEPLEMLLSFRWISQYLDWSDWAHSYWF